MKRILTYITSPSLLLLPIIVRAQATGGDIPAYKPVKGITTVDSFKNTIAIIANYAGGILMGVAVIMIIISAYYFVTAGSSEDNLKTARTYLIYALVGIAVALFAFALPSIVANVFG